MPLNVDNVNDAFSNTSLQFENDVLSRIQTLDGQDLSNAELINLQFEVARWQLATNTHSNVIRTVSEGIRSTIQNLR